MTEEIYQRLAKHLDNLPGGFPSTDNGIELRILRRLFTPEEAELSMHLTLIDEEPRVIARRAKITAKEAAQRLEEMAKRGLIFRMEPEVEGRPFRYMAYQFVIGIWEFHVNDLDEDLIRDVNEYLPTLTKEAIKLPQLRTIPVGQSVQADQKIMPYEKAEDLLKAQEKFAVAPCICRREHGMVGKECDRPLETCLIFGIAADYYLRNDLGRSIDQQEALNILKKSEEVGLVLQPGNSKEITNICCCCSCCCQYLKALKRHPKPASMASTPFMAAINRDTCQGCETCIDRCQMEAISMEDGMAALNLDRCIGCGLCISTCPTDSLTLIRKPETEQRDVPKDYVKTAINLAQTRGKLSTGKLMKMAFKSKVDRILAPK